MSTWSQALRIAVPWGGVARPTRAEPALLAAVTLLVHGWSLSPAFCQLWIEPDHQVNDPNGPDGDPNTPDDDNPLNGTYKAQFEPWIAVHPWYPGLAFGGWNDYSRTEEFRSDGFGTSNLNVSDPPPWTHDLVVDIPRPLPPAVQWQNAQGDPGCAIGGNGLFYQCGADWGPDPLRVYFARSPTGSGTQGWEVGFFGSGQDSNDTPKVIADRNTSPLRMNRVYVVWAPGDQAAHHRIMLSMDPNSGDGWIYGGALAQELSEPNVPTAVKKGPVGDVGPGGEFYVAWFQRNVPGNPPPGGARIMFNGTNEPFPASGPPVFFGPTTLVAGFDSLNGGRTDDRTNFQDDLWSWPAIAVDTSGCRFNGNIYVAYVEEEAPQAPVPNRVRVLVGRPSATGPPTWSAPVIVNWDAPGHSLQWFVAIAVDAKGRVGIIWHDTRKEDPAITNRQRFDVFFAYSLDGGATWSTNRRVTSESSFPDPLELFRNHKVGEYNGMAAAGESFYPIWMDLRRWSRNGADEAGDIFATRIDVTAWPDLDGDCDVDLTGDYPVFESCYSGDGNPFPPGCGNADFDADGDVDGADFLIFQKLLTGDGNCLCGGGASEEPFSDDGGQTWYTRTDVRACLLDHCASNLLPLP